MTAVTEEMKTIAVVGASLAGLSAARALRAAGFTGRLVVIGDEKHDPYDRPPLSKDFLAGRQEAADLALAAPTDSGLDLEWRLGQRATRLRERPGQGWTVELDGAAGVDCDGVVIATGARARRLPGSTRPVGPGSPGSPRSAESPGSLGSPESSGTAVGPEPRGVHTLRTLDDALALRAELVPGARLVVVGGGFIGAEIASTAIELGVTTTIVEVAATALAGPLGEELGAVLAALHVTRGVEVRTGVRVDALLSDDEPSGQARVTGVRLADGQELPADVVVVGIGSIPNTEWLAGSGLLGAGPDGDLAGGVAITEDGATNLPGVVATGDCAAGFSRFAGRVVRYEHWTNALQHPARAAATLLGVPAPKPAATAGVPYFWSDQHGLKLQFAGHYHPGDEVEVVEGDVAAHSFVAVYRREGRPVAVLGIGQPRVFGRWRKQLAVEANP
jgi:3-phenylpropionate/trans-cinnamate dioxygenase ferredoxin reductase component